MNVDTEPDEQRGFINLANYHEKYIKTAKIRVVESEISAYLPLQVFVFYNWYYIFFMFIILCALFAYKFIYFNYSSNFYEIAVIIIWFLAEILRLYFGFIGNVNENFSELIAFIIVTIIFSAPLLGYQFMFKIPLPLERALDIVQAIFLIFEVIFGIIAIKKLVKNQTAIFFLRNSHPDKYYRVSPI